MLEAWMQINSFGECIGLIAGIIAISVIALFVLGIIVRLFTEDKWL